jgi:hypothetical protein
MAPSETPPTWRARSPYLYRSGTEWPSYTPNTGFASRRFRRLAGLQWRYYRPPQQGERLGSAAQIYVRLRECSGAYENNTVPSIHGDQNEIQKLFDVSRKVVRGQGGGPTTLLPHTTVRPRIANYTDRTTAAAGETVATFEGRGCCMVSATNL